MRVSQVGWWALKSPRIKLSEEFGRRCEVEMSVSDGRGVDIEKEKRGSLLEVDFDTEIVWSWVGEGRKWDHLKGEVWVDQNENSPTILVSSVGWAPADEFTISSEDRVAWNFKELERLVSWRSIRSYQLGERKEQNSARRHEERPPDFHWRMRREFR